MPNGKPGDHPLTDILIHGHDVFSREAAELIRELAKLLSRSELNNLIDWFDPPPQPQLEAILRGRLAEARERAKARGWDLSDRYPGASAVEDLLLELARRAAAGGEVSLWVPDRLTIGGRPFPYSMAIELLRDKATELGLEPAGDSAGDGGRTFRFWR